MGYAFGNKCIIAKSIQRIDKLERWDHANLTKFNKAKWKFLHMGWGNPQYQYRLSREWI